MIKRAKPILLFTLVFATVALVGYAQVWAVKPACQEVQIFQDTIKIVWNPGCEVFKGVWFWKGNLAGDLYDSNCTGDCSPANPGGCNYGTSYANCWHPGDPVKLVMCTCEGSDCVGDIHENIRRERDTTADPPYVVTVECFPINDSGPKLGCPLFLNPPRVSVGGTGFLPSR